MSSPLAVDVYRPGDEEALREVCIRTGDSGQDATAKYAQPELLHLIYLDPYLAFAPDLAFVLRRPDGRAVGYAIGVTDTAAFEQTCENAWWGPLREQYQPGTTPDGMWGEALIKKIHTPDQASPELLTAYPAHLHIDILPEGQGSGNGRALMERLLDALAARGARGVHLGVGIRNENAIGYYKHLGFQVLVEAPWGLVMGMDLRDRAAAAASHTKGN